MLGDLKKKGPRGEYKKGDWLWIMTMGLTLGFFATLASNGWLTKLAPNFTIAAIFMMIAYIIVRLRSIKVGEIGNFFLTIATGVAFYFGPAVYPVIFGTTLGKATPMEFIKVGGVTFVTATPSLLIWIPVGFIGLLLIIEGGINKENAKAPPLITEVLAIGVGIFSFTTLIAGFLASIGFPFNINAEWALPPLTPLISYVWWIMGFVYLAIALGLWFKYKSALYGYAVLQVIGIGVSLFAGNWLGLIFNLLILGYLYLAKGEYHKLY
jgi:hypothetical protein